MLSDTHPDAERVQIELLRHATAAEKIAQCRALTAMAIALSRRAIARANPGLSTEEVESLWVELHYGRDIADRLRRHLQENAPCDLPT